MKKWLACLFGSVAALCAMLTMFGCETEKDESAQTLGNEYELRDGEDFAVTFRLSNIRSVNEETGGYEFTYLRLKHVYVNIAAIYTDAGGKAELTLGRGASETARAYTYTVTMNSNYMSNLGNWIEPFDITNNDRISNGYLNVESYKYVKIEAKGSNFLINEIVFIGEKVGSASDQGAGSGELYVIPAYVYKAKPVNDESTGDALVRASALIDTHRFTDDASVYRATYATDSQREEDTLNALRKDSVKISLQPIPTPQWSFRDNADNN